MVTMRKYIILLVAVALSAFSCAKHADDPTPVDPSQEEGLVFDFNVTYADSFQTKAVKSGWEAGDIIFVFFSTLTSPNYLKMKFDGSKWNYTQMNENVAGSLGLSNGDSGNMRAIYLPFANDNDYIDATNNEFWLAHPSTDPLGDHGYSYYFTYYLCSPSTSFFVSGNKITGTLAMSVPANYVQFFVNDASPANEAYQLHTAKIQPFAFQSVYQDNGNLLIREISRSQGSDMYGYAYGSGDKRGYLFSGKLVDEVEIKHAFFLTGGGFSYRYEISKAKALSSHASILLPANGDAKWVKQ